MPVASEGEMHRRLFFFEPVPAAHLRCFNSCFDMFCSFFCPSRVTSHAVHCPYRSWLTTGDVCHTSLSSAVHALRKLLLTAFGNVFCIVVQVRVCLRVEARSLFPVQLPLCKGSHRAVGITVRWVDHGAGAMTKRNGNIPMLQILMRTVRICITEEAAKLERHQMQPSSRSSSSKTRVDPAAQSNDTQSRSETRWSGKARQKNILGEL